MAAIGDVTRFASAEKLVSYFGLNPRVRQSGDGRAHHGRITKQGRSLARGLLVEVPVDPKHAKLSVARALSPTTTVTLINHFVAAFATFQSSCVQRFVSMGIRSSLDTNQFQSTRRSRTVPDHSNRRSTPCAGVSGNECARIAGA